MKLKHIDMHFGKNADETIGECKHRDDVSLNLSGVKCPMNIVKIKLKLEEMDDGQNLEIIVDVGEPMRSIPRAIKEDGHRITHAEKLPDGTFSLLVSKGGGA